MLKRVDSSWFQELPCLETLNLESNCIEEIEEFRSYSLKELNLRNNQLREFNLKTLGKYSYQSLAALVVFDNKMDPKIRSYFNQSLLNDRNRSNRLKHLFKAKNQRYFEKWFLFGKQLYDI